MFILFISMKINIALYTVGGQYMPIDELELWLEVMNNNSIDCHFNSDFVNSLEQKTDIKSYNQISDLPLDTKLVISYGGDGTFLQCVNKFFESDIPILGVNSGRLGFLANVSKKEIHKLVDCIVNDNYTIEPRGVMYCEELGTWALNECTVQKRGLSMISFKVCIDGEYVADYMADGIIVATPTGSTAYSLSLGGAIIAPNCDCIIINPIAPHNLSLRPLIVANGSVIRIEAKSRNADLLATMDNREYECENPAIITLRKSDMMVSFVKLPNVSFYATLREKLMWGVDKRVF